MEAMGADVWLSSGTLDMSGDRTVLRERGELAVSRRELVVSGDHRGAFGPDGRQIRDTLRLWGLGRGECPDTVPERVSVDGAVEHGTDVVWGGFRTIHYGHYLVESVARLWAVLPGGPLAGLPVVFATPAMERFATDWERAFGLSTVTLPDHGQPMRFPRIRPGAGVEDQRLGGGRDARHPHARSRGNERSARAGVR